MYKYFKTKILLNLLLLAHLKHYMVKVKLFYSPFLLECHDLQSAQRQPATCWGERLSCERTNDYILFYYLFNEIKSVLICSINIQKCLKDFVLLKYSKNTE